MSDMNNYMVVYLVEKNNDTKMFISYNDGYYTIYGSRRDLDNEYDIYNDYYISYHCSRIEVMKKFIELAFNNFNEPVNLTLYNIISSPYDICEYTFDEMKQLSRKSEVFGYDEFVMTEENLNKLFQIIYYT